MFLLILYCNKNKAILQILNRLIHQIRSSNHRGLILRVIPMDESYVVLSFSIAGASFFSSLFVWLTLILFS